MSGPKGRRFPKKAYLCLLRDAAKDMKESLIIYKASAGSGKTFTLAQNYLVQLLSKGARTATFWP